MNITTKPHKYHYVYKITNLFPVGAERFYIGCRSCNVRPERDNYWGSSVSLTEAINQQGKVDFAKEILSTWKTREEALEEEIRLHTEIGVKDHPEYYNKVNQTSTGFDSTGLVLTTESKKKISEAMQTICQTPMKRAERSIISKEIASRPEVKEKQSAAAKKYWSNDETKERMSRKVHQYWDDSERKNNHSLLIKEALNRPEIKGKLSGVAKQRWQDPEFRKKHAEAMARSRQLKKEAL